jgi:SNF2 family DNA or RNA helicase
MKSEVESQLPGKAEYVLKCELSAMQKTMYRQIQGAGLCTVGAAGQLKVSGLNNVEMQLRKVCNHPYLHFSEEQLDAAAATPTHIYRTSGKFEMLHRLLPKLHKLGHRVLIFSQVCNHICNHICNHLCNHLCNHICNHICNRVLIFSQMVKLMDILQDYLHAMRYKLLRLDGHTKGDERGELLEKFNTDDSYAEIAADF